MRIKGYGALVSHPPQMLQSRQMVTGTGEKGEAMSQEARSPVKDEIGARCW